MERYGNLNGNSSVVGFEIRTDRIKVQFRNSITIYIYTYAVPGRYHVEKMKSLAGQGRGLNAYINTHVKNREVEKYVN